jgi:hypothetical protein
MASDRRPVALSNLRISLAPTLLGNPSGEIYGKMVESVDESPQPIRIRFGSVTPELKTWIRALAL